MGFKVEFRHGKSRGAEYSVGFSTEFKGRDYKDLRG